MSRKNGFTLVELMVTMGIIAVLAGLTLATFAGAKKNARDGKRKADLEQIRSALEMYRTDKGYYPPKDQTGWCTVLWGCGYSTWYNDVAGALISGGYLSSLPQDTLYSNTSKDYFYRHVSNNQYELYSTLELVTSPTYSTAGCACGTSDVYHYKVTNP